VWSDVKSDSVSQICQTTGNAKIHVVRLTNRLCYNVQQSIQHKTWCRKLSSVGHVRKHSAAECQLLVKCHRVYKRRHGLQRRRLTDLFVITTRHKNTTQFETTLALSPAVYRQFWYLMNCREAVHHAAADSSPEPNNSLASVFFTRRAVNLAAGFADQHSCISLDNADMH